ncbi:MAG TPA: alpha/beta hydrolase [Bryobacteraceae bacterium]|jgi:pimeloyl-ACP methyl ester carboxylesterase|nr:alpha/beta hydrolase [Bryobacteraceae bacterium]
MGTSTRRQHIEGLAASLASAIIATKADAANQGVAYGQTTIPAGIRSRFVDNNNGLRVHVLEAGFEGKDRSCVLLLHGFPELAYSWRKVMPPLASAGYHVIAPDQRGYGRTTGWDGNYDGDLSAFSTLNMVRDALGLVSALGYRSVAAVVGHDAGSPVAAWCSLIRPDVFRSVAMMSAPFAGPPALPFNSANDGRHEVAVPPGPSVDEQLAALPRPRKYYQRYYTTRDADNNMRNCPQGLHAFFRAYYYYKSADWKQNRPFPLKARTAEEMAKMPTYYVMDLDKGMCETAAEHMPSAAEIAACKWLTDEDVEVYAAEYGRTGFQGGLNGYRRGANAKLNAELQTFSGRSIDVPSCFISGKSDWGVYQTAGAVERMRNSACTKMEGFHLVDGAGHWVQQEQHEEVARLLLDFLRRHS